MEEGGRRKRRRVDPEGTLRGLGASLSLLRSASPPLCSHFLIQSRKRAVQGSTPQDQTSSFLFGELSRRPSYQDVPAVKAEKGKRGRAGRSTREWEEGPEDCAMPLKKNFFLTADLSRLAWIAARKISSVKWVGHGPRERGTSEWMASPNDSGELLSLARAYLVG